MDNIDIHLLFPKTVAKTIVNLSVQEKSMLNVTYNNNVFVSSKGGNSPEMSHDLYVLNGMPWLADKFNNVITEFTKNFLKWDNTRTKMSTSWFTKTKKGQESVYHSHANNIYSGVFYWDNVEKAKITFENFNLGHHWEIQPKELNQYNNCQYSFELEDCELLIFPSELHHKIEPWIHEEDRKSLAFNWIPIGELGVSDSRVVL